MRQKIGFYFRIHQILLNFIKENSYNFQKLILLDKISLESKQKFFKIYQSIYKWLRFFVKNNHKHQLVLYEEIEFFFTNLDLDLGQIDLICEIFRNNHELIKNVKDRHLKKFIACIKNYGHRQKFLLFFEIIQSCHNEYILDNQAKIIDYLYLYPLNESPETLYNVLYSTPRENEGLIFNLEISQQNFEDEERKIKAQFANNLYGNEPFEYHIKLLSLFINAQKGAEGYNLNNARIKKIFSLKFLLEILVGQDELFMSFDQLQARKKLKNVFTLVVESISLEESTRKPNVLSFQHQIKDITKLKLMVLEFYNEIYLKSLEKNLEQFNNFIDFLQNFILREKERLEINEKNFYKNQALMDYFFGKVLVFLNKYVKFIMGAALLAEVDTYDRKDNEMLYCIAEILERNLINMKSLLNNEQFDNLREFLSNYFEISEEMERNIQKCLILQEGDSELEKKMKFGTNLFDEEDDVFKSESVLGWKHFLGLVLGSDALENVCYLSNLNFKKLIFFF